MKRLLFLLLILFLASCRPVYIIVIEPKQPEIIYNKVYPRSWNEDSYPIYKRYYDDNLVPYPLPEGWKFKYKFDTIHLIDAINH